MNLGELEKISINSYVGPVPPMPAGCRSVEIRMALTCFGVVAFSDGICNENNLDDFKSSLISEEDSTSSEECDMDMISGSDVDVGPNFSKLLRDTFGELWHIFWKEKSTEYLAGLQEEDGKGHIAFSATRDSDIEEGCTSLSEGFYDASGSRSFGGSNRYENLNEFHDDFGEKSTADWKRATASDEGSTFGRHMRIRDCFSNFGTNFLRQIKRLFYSQQSWIFLLVLSVILSLLGVLIEESILFLFFIREYLVGLADAIALKYVVWIAYSVLYCILGMLVVRYVSPYSSGSGIPAIKSILSGVSVWHYLSFRTMVAKAFGLLFACSSGMFIGKEGPYVHMSMALANQLGNLPIFRRLKDKKNLKLQLLAAGCAAGVAITFGTPIGGVIFSIEVTSTYYMIENLTMSFFCTLVVLLVVNTIDKHQFLRLLITDFATFNTSSSVYEVVNSVLIGIVCGVLGIIFIFFVKTVIRLRKTHKILHPHGYVQLIIIAAVSAFISYSFPPIYDGYHKLLGDVFKQPDLSAIPSWSGFNQYVALLLLIFIYFFMCSISISLPLVCGLYTPVFICGALIGRLFGQVITQVFNIGLERYSARCAVLGAAALSASVTRTLSSSIICFELTRQISFLLPTLLSVIVSYAIANTFVSSIYDELLKMKGLPYVPSLKIRHKKTAISLIKSNEPLLFISTNSTYEDLKDLLHRTHYSSFPLVKHPDNKILLGTLSRKVLKSIAYDFYKNLKTHLQQSEKDGSAPADMTQEMYNEAVNSPLGLDIGTPGLKFTTFQFPVFTPAHRVHFVFNMLRLKFAYVVDQGEIAGVITKKNLINIFHYSSS